MAPPSKVDDQLQTMGTSNDDSPERWKMPWNPDQMRSCRDKWTLAGDAGLLEHLHVLSQKLLARTHQIQQDLNLLNKEAKSSSVMIGNAVNAFLMLSNTQFVENRVYDEEMQEESEDKSKVDDQKTKRKSKEQQEVELIPRIAEALHLGLEVMEAAFERHQLPDSDSEEDESPPRTLPVFEPKDRYGHRPLPHIIGSERFLSDDFVGLGELSSEDEMQESDKASHSASEDSIDNDEGDVSMAETHSSSELESDLDSDLRQKSTRQSLTNQVIADDGSDFFTPQIQGEEDALPQVQLGSKVMADELAAKLGGILTSGRSRSKDEPSDSPQHSEKKSGRSRSSSTASKSSRITSSVERKRISQKNDVEFDDTEDGEEAEDALFDRKGGLFSGGGGLFDDLNETEEDDLFSGVDRKYSQPKRDFAAAADDDEMFFSPPEVGKSSKTNRRTRSSSGKLFDDDFEDSLGAGTKESSNPMLASKDDEALPVDTPKKKLRVGAVLMFGGAVTPLTAAIKARGETLKHDEEEDSWLEPSRSKKLSSGDSSSLFVDEPIPVPVVSNKVGRGTDQQWQGTGIFGDESDTNASATLEPATLDHVSRGAKCFIDDPIGKEQGSGSQWQAVSLFGDEPITESSKGAEKPISTKSSKTNNGFSLFDDDDDDSDADLFGSNVLNSKAKNSVKVDDPPATINAFPHYDEAAKERGPFTAAATKISLFDDDDPEDLFLGSTRTEAKPVKESIFRPKTDDALLLGIATTTLHTHGKDRAKVGARRRPPTRKGRQEALRKSGIFPEDETAVIESPPLKNTNDELKPFPVAGNKDGSSIVASPSTEEDDVSLTLDLPPMVNSSSKEDCESIWASPQGQTLVEGDVFSIVDAKPTADMFAVSNSHSASPFAVDDEIDDDIFSNLQPSAVNKVNSSKSLFDDDDDDFDIFRDTLSKSK